MTRKILLTALVGSMLFAASTYSWNKGYKKGYITAMADVELGLTTSEKFFHKYFKRKAK